MFLFFQIVLCKRICFYSSLAHQKHHLYRTVLEQIAPRLYLQTNCKLVFALQYHYGIQNKQSRTQTQFNYCALISLRYYIGVSIKISACSHFAIARENRAAKRDEIYEVSFLRMFCYCFKKML